MADKNDTKIVNIVNDNENKKCSVCLVAVDDEQYFKCNTCDGFFHVEKCSGENNVLNCCRSCCEKGKYFSILFNFTVLVCPDRFMILSTK